MKNQGEANLLQSLNMLGVITAYVLLALSLYLSTEVPLATKGYWGMGILLLTLSLVNVVRIRFDSQASVDRVKQLEEAHNERLLAEFVTDKSKV